MFDALSLIWVHAFGTPAANKWLTVLPVVSDFALLAAFHNVLCEAILVAHKLNPSKDVDSDGSSDREDAELGAPRNAQKAYRKEAGKRSKRGKATRAGKSEASLALQMRSGMCFLNLGGGRKLGNHILFEVFPSLAA